MPKPDYQVYDIEIKSLFLEGQKSDHMCKWSSHKSILFPISSKNKFSKTKHFLHKTKIKSSKSANLYSSDRSDGDSGHKEGGEEEVRREWGGRVLCIFFANFNKLRLIEFFQ